MGWPKVARMAAGSGCLVLCPWSKEVLSAGNSWGGVEPPALPDIKEVGVVKKLCCKAWKTEPMLTESCVS